jgi:hypothetical protein
MVELLLRFVLVLATSVWVGGMVTIAVVAGVARRTLGTVERVQFFRGLGRIHGVVGGLALVTALAAGAALVADHPRDRSVMAGAVVAGALLVVTGVGIVQARRMTELRLRAAATPGDHRVGQAVRRGAQRAAVLRALIGVLTVALILLGVLVSA